MSVKKFILSGLALGAMLMGSTPAHAQVPVKIDADLGTLPNLGATSRTVSIHNEPKVFKFFHPGGELNLGVVNVKPTSPFSFKQNLKISLYEDTVPDGVFDISVGQDAFLLGSIAGGTDNNDRKIFTRKKAGIYYALVGTGANTSDVSYTFMASSTGSNESNLLAASEVVDPLNAGFKLLPLDDNKTSDIYKFTLLAGKHVSMTMTPTGGQAKMRVIQDVGSDRVVTLGTEVVKSTPASSGASTITINNSGNKAFTYYLQVSQSVPGQKVATEVKFTP